MLARLLFQGILTSIVKKPYIFVIFQGAGGGSGPPIRLWIRACLKQFLFLSDEKYQGMAMEADVYIITVCAVPSYLFAFHQGT